MHNNFYFLRQLSMVLQQKLVGHRLETCFSQEKDELILGFTNGKADFYIKAQLSSRFTALSFPATFNRARVNSATLFPEVSGKQVLGVVQQNNERSFYLTLEDGWYLLFKMYGNRANIVLFEGEKPSALFQNKFGKDLDLPFHQLNREVNPDKAVFLKEQPPITHLYPTWGDLPVLFLNQQGYQQAAPERQWELLEETRALLENPAYYIIQLNDRVRLSLLPVGEVRRTFAEPMAALQDFVRLHQTEISFANHHQLATLALQKKLESGRRYLEEVEYKMLELEYDQSFSQTADLIMANLTNIPPRAREVEVDDFYQDRKVTIRLPERESPQKFAEKLYRKNKNRQIELRFLGERAGQKKEELNQLVSLLNKLQGITTGKELKQFLKLHPLVAARKQEEVPLPYRLFQAEGFKILVGKSAAANDQLTQQFTFKEDLWLHAKDVAGSHVVIKYQAGKNFPGLVIEKAAQLAAWYSKRKNDSLCPVTYTPKKYVRKPKGAAPGAVVVEKEQVLLVQPQNPFRQGPT